MRHKIGPSTLKIFTYVKSKQKNRVKKKIENEQKEGNIDERRAKIYIIHNACVCLCQRQNVFSLLEGKLVTNGKLEHAVLVVLILEGFGQTKVVATLNNEVAELIAQADRHRSAFVREAMLRPTLGWTENEPTGCCANVATEEISNAAIAINFFIIRVY